MKIILGLAYMLILSTAWAQSFSSEVFHEGFLVTDEKDTIKGQLKYDMEANIVSIIIKGKIKTFSSHNIFYFEINDKILNTYRQFYSIPYAVNYGYKTSILFELLYEGALSFLIRETLVQQVQTSASPYWGNNYPRTVIRYSFYFLNIKGDIIYYSGRKKDLLRIMAKKQSHIKKFIKDGRLNTSDVKDLIRIVAFYNSI